MTPQIRSAHFECCPMLQIFFQGEVQRGNETAATAVVQWPAREAHPARLHGFPPDKTQLQPRKRNYASTVMCCGFAVHKLHLQSEQVYAPPVLFKTELWHDKHSFVHFYNQILQWCFSRSHIAGKIGFISSCIVSPFYTMQCGILHGWISVFMYFAPFRSANHKVRKEKKTFQTVRKKCTILSNSKKKRHILVR